VSLDANGSLFSYGDYTGLSFVSGSMQPIWADNSVELPGVPDRRQFDVANARIAVVEVSRAPLVVQTFGVDDVEGHEFTARVAAFSDPGGPGLSSAYKAKINWGDNTAPSDAIVRREEDGSFSVLGTHEYKTLGRYMVNVSIKGPHTKAKAARLR
jgi:hypothetical protein